MAKQIKDLRSLARSYTEVAVQTLAGISKNGKNENARVAASSALLNRGWGQPTQTVSGEGEDGQIIVQIIQKIREPRE
jgi:hypothetical protein